MSLVRRVSGCSKLPETVISRPSTRMFNDLSDRLQRRAYQRFADNLTGASAITAGDSSTVQRSGAGNGNLQRHRASPRPNQPRLAPTPVLEEDGAITTVEGGQTFGNGSACRRYVGQGQLQLRSGYSTYSATKENFDATFDLNARATRDRADQNDRA